MSKQMEVLMRDWKKLKLEALNIPSRIFNSERYSIAKAVRFLQSKNDTNDSIVQLTEAQQKFIQETQVFLSRYPGL